MNSKTKHSFGLGGGNAGVMVEKINGKPSAWQAGRGADVLCYLYHFGAP